MHWGGFFGDEMSFEELKEKALSLTMEPGVYIMRNKADDVIYVGKAKKLRNRVSQYFQDTASHTPKTKLMVSKIDHFDVIVAASEFEALVLECSLIKRYMPKYNILLKDDKGYPYLRLDLREEYPRIEMVSKLKNDGAQYYGPYGSRSISQAVLETVRSTLRLPDCARRFPRDIGKQRPCLNYHMNQCQGWCRAECPPALYRKTIEQAKQLLSGDYKSVAAEIKSQMLEAAESLEFELAASLRNQLNAVEALGQKQLVTAGSLADTDVIGYYQTEAKACFSVLHYAGGNLLDKDYEIVSVQDDPETAVSSLIKQYYLKRGVAPKVILLPFRIEDDELFCELILQSFGKKTKIKVPSKGEGARLIELAVKNAREEAIRVTSHEEKTAGVLKMLGKCLSMEPPKRIESYDISNISGTDTVASMVVFTDGKANKSQYKRFKIEGLDGPDDYGAMQQVLTRRFTHYLSGDEGFQATPDLLLIDGGIMHAAVAEAVLNGLELSFPVFGMVKDDRHRTRALVTSAGEEISIDTQQSLFAFIGSIQEETHRFAITYHRQLRSKRLRYSQLDNIPGIGPKRKQQLLKTFKSLRGIGQASLPELERILPKDAAMSVYTHFRKHEEE